MTCSLLPGCCASSPPSVPNTSHWQYSSTSRTCAQKVYLCLYSNTTTYSPDISDQFHFCWSRYGACSFKLLDPLTSPSCLTSTLFVCECAISWQWSGSQNLYNEQLVGESYKPSMSHSTNNPVGDVLPDEQEQYCHQFMWAGWWVGTLPPPPDLTPYYRSTDMSCMELQGISAVHSPHQAAGPHLVGLGIPPMPPVAPLPLPYPSKTRMLIVFISILEVNNCLQKIQTNLQVSYER